MKTHCGIQYPCPVGVPPTFSDMEYDTAVGLLPLEEQLLEHFKTSSTGAFDNLAKQIQVYGRQHTVVGHYSEFSPLPRSVPSSESQKLEEATFFIDGCNYPFGAILYIYNNIPNCIEIYGLGENFPPDGIVRSVKAITFGDPNLSEWQEGIKP